MSTRINLASALVALIVGCSCQRPPKPSPTPPSPMDPSEACFTFCEVTARFKCPQAEHGPGPDEVSGTLDDVPCIDVCKELLAVGNFKGDSACIKASESCERAEWCLLGD